MEAFSNKKNFQQTRNGFFDVHDYSQINWGISSAINDRVISEIQNIMGSPCSGQQNTESGMSGNDQENNEQANGLKTKITKKDSWSAFDFRDTGDLSPYKK